MPSFKITEWGHFIDMHVHLPAAAAAEEALFEALIEQMTAVGLRKIIVVNTLHGEANRWAPTLAQLLNGWERLRQWTARDSARRFGMAFLSAPGLRGKSIRELGRRFVEEGAVGFKVTLSSKNGDAICPEVYRFVETAVEFGKPILFHDYLRPCAARPGELTPADVAGIARRYPEARIILAHAGADYQRALPVYADIPNILVDISGTRCYEGMVETILQWLAPERVLYGSDLYGRGPWSQLAKLAGAGIPPAARRMILHDNAECLFFGGCGNGI